MSDDKTVFISYRRSNSAFIARAVFQDLRANGFDVFMDVESIDAGAFSNIILNQIAARAHFVLILAPGTLDRCSEPGDWLRREIEKAIKLERNIVPLLFSGFSFSTAAPSLTGDLAQLSQLNALNVPHDFFEEAMARLRNRFLKQPVFGVVHPAPAADLAEVRRKVAEATAESAPTPKELSAEEYFQQGLARTKTDYDGKIADYSQTIRLSPQFADAYYNRGIAYKAKGDLDSALSDYSQAIRLNPQFADAYYNRGMIYDDKGDLDSALSDYHQAIRLSPQFANAYYNRGIAYKAKGDLDSALSDYSQAIRLNPQFVDAYYNRGNAFKAKGDFSAAIVDYQKYLDLGGGIRDGDQEKVEGWIRDLKAKLGK